MNIPTVAILASGEGTTAEAFIRACGEEEVASNVNLVISNNESAGIFKRVAALNKQYGLQIETTCIGKNNYPAGQSETLRPGQQTNAEELALIDILREGNFDAILLLGYMRQIGPRLVHAFGWRDEYTSPYQASMLNTHPGLLPATKGLYGIYVQEYVLQEKLNEAGQTLHVVAENYDEGPTIAEHRVSVLPTDNAESLFERVKQAEKQYIAADVYDFIIKRNQYLGGK